MKLAKDLEKVHQTLQYIQLNTGGMRYCIIKTSDTNNHFEITYIHIVGVQCVQKDSRMQTHACRQLNILDFPWMLRAKLL